MSTNSGGAAVSAPWGPHTPPPRKEAITTLYFPSRTAWSERLDMLDAGTMSRTSIVGRLVSESRYYQAVVLDGDGAPPAQLMAAALIGHRRNRPPVILADCAWGPSSGRIGRVVDRSAIRLIDSPRVHYCVHSREQQSCFSDLWGVARERVHLNPYYYTLTEMEIAAPTQRDGSVFSGGRSRRDFATLIEAAQGIDAPVTIGGQVSPTDRKRLPPNVRAQVVPHEEFCSLLCRASVVVVSIEQTMRSAGEQTYLNAMAIGKPVIVTDTMGVRDYVSHRETGLIIPPGDASALRTALAWVLDPANDAEVQAMGKRAREVALTRFSPDQYIAKLLSVLDQVLAEESDLEPRPSMSNDASPLERTFQKAMRTGYRIVGATPLSPILDTSLVRRLKSKSLEMSAETVASVLEALHGAGVSAWLVGGWGIDALIGEQTRRHRDLDVVFSMGPDAEEHAVGALTELGFKFVKREAVPGADPACWLATRLVMADDAGHVVDLHPVAFPLVVASGQEVRRFEPKDAFVTGTVGGRPVPCLSAELQLALHEGYEARRIDREDVARLGSRR